MSVTTTQLPLGDSHCPYGGSALTGANGTSYVCDTPPPVEDVTWNPTVQDGAAVSNTQIEAGSTVQALSATLTGDLSSCAGGFFAGVSTYGIPGYLAAWSETSGSDYSTALAATSYVGDSYTESGASPLYVSTYCDDSSDSLIPWPSGVQISITIQWTHAVATRTIS